MNLIRRGADARESRAHSGECGNRPPGGGTALWDAVGFAAQKLAERAETQPVARMLVVISDGEDNSSFSPRKEAIAKAQQSEVAVYTITTREAADKDASGLLAIMR